MLHVQRYREKSPNSSEFSITYIFYLLLTNPLYPHVRHEATMSFLYLLRSWAITSASPIARPISDSSAIIYLIHVVLGATLWFYSCGCPSRCYPWYVIWWHSQGMALPSHSVFFGSGRLLVENLSFYTDLHWISYLTRIYCISSVDIFGFEIQPACAYHYCWHSSFGIHIVVLIWRLLLKSRTFVFRLYTLDIHMLRRVQ